MSKKIGRNDPCWCGSGRKYKHCHYRRDQQEEASVQDVIETFKKGFRKPECLHPEAPTNCRGGIIKAHTIQKNGGLTKIAKAGHIYTLFSAVPSFRQSGTKKPEMRREGINIASTFTGFCKYHDNLLFAPIEDNTLEISRHHALLLAFRAVSKELYAKRRAIELIPFGKSLDRGKDVMSQYNIQEYWSLYQLGSEAGLRDLEYSKSLMNKAILNKAYDDVYFYVIKLDRTPDMLCSGAISPEFDFHGNPVQNLANIENVTDCLAFSLLAHETGGVAYFSWIGEGKSNLSFIRSLHTLSNSDVVHALVRFTFEHFENTYMSPDWWDGLPQETRDRLLERYWTTIDPLAERKSNCLEDDGIRAITWNVTGRETNIAL